MTGDVRRFDAVVFDMDGLLIDSEPLWHEAEIDVFGRHGVELTVDMCRQTKGKFVGEATRHWYALYPWEGDSPEAVTEEVITAMVVMLDERVALKDGAVAAVEFFAGLPMPLALASSSPRRLIELVLRRTGLDRAFSVVCSGQEEAAGKPDPAIFLTAARLLGVAPQRCVVFEDSPAGVRAAKSAAMTCVAVPEERVTAAGGDEFAPADVVLRSLAEVDALWWQQLQGR